MQEFLQIKWNTGSATIVLNEFFPCSVQRFRKRLKLVEMDWDNEDSIKEKLKVYFQEQSEELTNLHAVEGKRYLAKRQLVIDAQERVKTKKHPNGVRLSKDKLDFWRQTVKDAKDEAATALKAANQLNRDKQQLEKLSLMIQ